MCSHNWFKKKASGGQIGPCRTDHLPIHFVVSANHLYWGWEGHHFTLDGFNWIPLILGMFTPMTHLWQAVQFFFDRTTTELDSLLLCLVSTTVMMGLLSINRQGWLTRLTPGDQFTLFHLCCYWKCCFKKSGETQLSAPLRNCVNALEYREGRVSRRHDVDRQCAPERKQVGYACASLEYYC